MAVFLRCASDITVAHCIASDSPCTVSLMKPWSNMLLPSVYLFIWLHPAGSKFARPRNFAIAIADRSRDNLDLIISPRLGRSIEGKRDHLPPFGDSWLSLPANPRRSDRQVLASRWCTIEKQYKTCFTFLFFLPRRRIPRSASSSSREQTREE
jgi:hypothetical protein